MDIYFTVDEKYLQAVDEYHYGEMPKSLQMLNEIIAADPQYARAYCQLGMIYFYELNDYQQAGYCFKTCNELDVKYPDVYSHYMKLLSFLNMEKMLNIVKERALQAPGVDYACMWELMGKFAERNKNLLEARTCYEEAYAVVTNTKKMGDIEESLKRVEEKQLRKVAYRYSLS